MGRSPILPLPLTGSQYRAVAVLMGLMLFSAVTEGFGLLLLVPMLGLLAGSDGEIGRIAEMVAALGIPLELGWLLAIFVVLVLLRALVNYARTLQAFNLEIALVDSLRARVWGALLNSDWRHLSQMRQSDNASLLISNIDRIGYGISELLRALAIVITLAAVGLAAFAISPYIAMSAAAVGVAVLIAYRGLRRRAAVLGDELNSAYDGIHARMTEGLGGLRVIKSFGREDRALETGAMAFAGLRRTQRAFIRDSGRAQIGLQAGGALCLALLVWFAITRWDAGAVEIIPLVALFARALPLIAALQRAGQEWAHCRPAIGVTLDLIESAEAARESTGNSDREAPDLHRAITLTNVSVSFSDRSRRALDQIALEFPKGSVTAIEGPSGAGKSTLADLLAGLIGPDEGEVAVDGVRLDGALRRAWRQRVTYVQQDPVLFAGTVRENLHWADPEADEARLRQVLQSSSATFAHDLPEGLDTTIGDAGHQLSGGERQRLVLARALLRDPALLILDEVSSALDAENEAEIARAVAGLKGAMTIVMIGHRGALCDVADRTVRLDEGRIVAESGD